MKEGLLTKIYLDARISETFSEHRWDFRMQPTYQQVQLRVEELIIYPVWGYIWSPLENRTFWNMAYSLSHRLT